MGSGGAQTTLSAKTVQHDPDLFLRRKLASRLVPALPNVPVGQSVRPRSLPHLVDDDEPETLPLQNTSTCLKGRDGEQAGPTKLASEPRGKIIADLQFTPKRA